MRSWSGRRSVTSSTTPGWRRRGTTSSRGSSSCWTRRRIRPHCDDQDHVTGAGAAVVVFGNTDPAAHAQPVFDDWLDKGYLPSEDVKEGLLESVDGMAGLPETERRVWTTRSSSLAAMTLMYAAWDRGVASCPMEGFDADALLDTFDVPEGYEPVMIVTLGYAADGTDDIENDRKTRRSVDEITHFGEFDPVAETTLDDETVDAVGADD